MSYIKPEKSVMAGFANRFVELTKNYDKGDSNASLGKHFGVSSTTIFKWKNAESMPKMENACLIALRYQVCVEWLLTGRGDIKITSTGSELDRVMALLPLEFRDRLTEQARAYLALQQQSL